MKLLDVYKKSFSTAISNPFVTLFLVLFMIISNILAAYMFQTKDITLGTILSFCVFMLSLCFISGWFYVIKEIIQNKENENKNYFGIFFEGVGKNIIPIGIGSFIYTILIFISIIIAIKLTHFDSSFLNQPTTNFMELYNNLTPEQKDAIATFELSALLCMMAVNFLMLFYFPAIIHNEKSNIFLKPFISLKDAIFFLFRNFPNAFFIHFSICVIYMLLGALNVKLSTNIFASILILFIYIYFIASAIMLIFMYYEQKNNCDNGCDCIGENENIDKPSEEV